MTRALLTSLALIAVAGCDDGGGFGCGDEPSGGQQAVIAQLGFGVMDSQGRAPGFDLDGIVSVGRDEESCYQPDFVDPEGREGVDNQLARLWPALAALTGDAVDGFIQSAIHDGRLLLVLDLQGFDDSRDDDCLDARLLLGAGDPHLGTDGFIFSGQTFEEDPTVPASVAAHAAIEDGVLTAGPFERVQVQVRIFDLDAPLNVRGALLRARLSEDGSIEGVFGGSVEIDEIYGLVADRTDVPDTVKSVMRTQLDDRADLAPDGAGACRAISVSVVLRGVKAFLTDFED